MSITQPRIGRKALGRQNWMRRKNISPLPIDLTAATLVGAVGYSAGSLLAAGGSITRQPVQGLKLQNCMFVDLIGIKASFRGNYVSYFTGSTVRIGSTTYNLLSATYNLLTKNTDLIYTAITTPFTAGNTYTVTFAVTA